MAQEHWARSSRRPPTQIEVKRRLTIKIFENDRTDWVVAESEADATRLFEMATGESKSDYEFEWTECEPESSISAWFDPDCEPFPIPAQYLTKVGRHENLYKATVAEWLEMMTAANFRGYWVTTEY